MNTNGYLQNLRWADHHVTWELAALGTPDYEYVHLDCMDSTAQMVAYNTFMPGAKERALGWGKLTLWMKYVEAVDIIPMKIWFYNYEDALLGTWYFNGPTYQPGKKGGYYCWTSTVSVGTAANPVATVLFDLRPCSGYPLAIGIDAAQFEHYQVLRV